MYKNRIPRNKRRNIKYNNMNYEWCISKKNKKLSFYIHSLDSGESLKILFDDIDVPILTPYEKPTFELSCKLVKLLNDKDISNNTVFQEFNISPIEIEKLPK